VYKITTVNSKSYYMRGFGGLLTKYYLSKVVQRGTMKQGENPHIAYLRTVIGNLFKAPVDKVKRR